MELRLPITGLAEDSADELLSNWMPQLGALYLRDAEGHGRLAESAPGTQLWLGVGLAYEPESGTVQGPKGRHALSTQVRLLLHGFLLARALGGSGLFGRLNEADIVAVAGRDSDPASRTANARDLMGRLREELRRVIDEDAVDRLLPRKGDLGYELRLPPKLRQPTGGPAVDLYGPAVQRAFGLLSSGMVALTRSLDPRFQLLQGLQEAWLAENPRGTAIWIKRMTTNRAVTEEEVALFHAEIDKTLATDPPSSIHLRLPLTLASAELMRALDRIRAWTGVRPLSMFFPAGEWLTREKSPGIREYVARHLNIARLGIETAWSAKELIDQEARSMGYVGIAPVTSLFAGNMVNVHAARVEWDLLGDYVEAHAATLGVHWRFSKWTPGPRELAVIVVGHLSGGVRELVPAVTDAVVSWLKRALEPPVLGPSIKDGLDELVAATMIGCGQSIEGFFQQLPLNRETYAHGSEADNDLPLVLERPAWEHSSVVLLAYLKAGQLGDSSIRTFAVECLRSRLAAHLPKAPR